MIDNGKVKTAYGENLASNYEEIRFKSVGGIRIHQTESGILLGSLNLVPKSSSALEVGCGTGRLIGDATRAGYKVAGIDPSIAMLSILRENFSQTALVPRTYIGEGSKLPFRDNSFDFVYSIRVLNQTESQLYAYNTITEMIRITRIDGYALIEFMNYYRAILEGKRVRFTGQTVGRSTSKNVRLRPAEVKNVAEQPGIEAIWLRGAFFFGMTALNIIPDFLVDPLNKVDQIISRVWPRSCSRCYLLVKKTK